jgi:hypothetical protein
MSCSQAECVIAPQRHHAIGANSHIEDILTWVYVVLCTVMYAV